MADVLPLRALHHVLSRTGGLTPVLSPPYDVIDPEQRAELAARSPYNAVHVDLPETYDDAARLLAEWQRDGALVRDDEDALWVVEQEFTGPDGVARRRRGLLARVRVEDYGPGRIRPHERTHPGPKEDRLALTRATRTNLSPIFALHGGDAVGALGEDLGAPHGTADGVALWRVAEPDRIAAALEVLRGEELLIADGHHRYETARVFAEEAGGEGGHRYCLMCLVSLEDPGLVVFPTHRLVRVRGDAQEALARTLREHFDLEEVPLEALAPPPGDGPLTLGYVDAHFRRGFRCTLRDPSVVDPLLPPALRELDTAVLEALVLKGPLGLTDDDISHFNGLGYSRTDEEALSLVVEERAYDAAFLLRPSPVAQVRRIAAAGEVMPPKSTFFHPKVPTGLLFNPLD